MDISTSSRTGGDGLEAFEPRLKKNQARRAAAKRAKEAEVTAAKAASEEAKAAPVKAANEAIDATKAVKGAVAAAESAADTVTAKTTREVAKEAVEDIASKAKTGLSHAGMAGIGAAGLFGLFAMSRGERKSQIAPRRRKGQVHEHPRFDSFGRRSTIAGASMMGALVAGVGLATKRGSPATRAFMALGGAVGAGLGVSRLYKDDPAVATLGMATAGAAASLAYILVSKNSAAGLRSLRNFATKQGPKSVVQGALNAVTDAKNKFPLLDSFLSKEGLALGAGLITLPAAHSIMVKHFAAEKRRTTDHRDIAFMPAWQDHKAGHKGFRKNNNPLFASNASNTADVNFLGSLHSYYDSASIFQGV